MKIQPINDTAEELDSSAVVPVVKAVVRSRLRRLFRISSAVETVAEAVVETVEETETEMEPSSVCLGKMVRNYIEENNERQVRCGRNRCSCFNGCVGGSDGDGGGGDGDCCHYLKRLMISASVNERKVKADMARVLAEKSKGCKRKDVLMKLVMEGLMAIGYDVAICKSKWDKSPSFPAGEYDYIDVIVGGERLIIDVDFRSEFEVAKSTKTYKSILQILPNVFVGKSDRLSKIICIVSEAAKQSLKKKGMPIPPWRKSDYFRAKWLSPPTRIANTSVVVSAGLAPDTPAPKLAAVLPVARHSDDHEASRRSSQPVTVFDMSESSEEDIKAKLKEVSCRSSQPETDFDMSGSSEEDVKVKFKVTGDLFLIRPKKNMKIVSGLSSIMEDQP